MNNFDFSQAQALLKPRATDSHKGSFGHALLRVGSSGMMGAAILAARACLRSGVGLTTVWSTESERAILQTAVPEALFTPNPRHWKTYQAIGCGCGIGRSEQSLDDLLQILGILQSQLQESSASCQAITPLILDADALNLVARYSLHALIPAGTIITPHPLELARLVGGNNAEETAKSARILQDGLKAFSQETWIDKLFHGGYLLPGLPVYHLREAQVAPRATQIEQAQALAAQYHWCVVVKGAPTVVVSPEGELSQNTTGNNGMATAGSGDVLTGIITSLVAQGYTSFEAARLGVFLHGLAGDLATQEGAAESVIAGDLVGYLSKAFKALHMPSASKPSI